MPFRSGRAILYVTTTGRQNVLNGTSFTFTITGQILLGIEQANMNLRVSNDGISWIVQNLDANAPPYIPGPGSITVANGRVRLENDIGIDSWIMWAGWKLR